MDEKIIEVPQELTPEITDKYRVENNTFKQEVKDNPKDRIEVEIGDAKQTDFKPQVKIMRWDNEVNFSMRAEEHPDAVVETEGKIIKYITPEYEVHQYDKPDAGEDGGHEFEWVLPSKPSTNVLTATIQTKGLDFFYQPPLTPEEILEGDSMAENVEGSYAVYHATKGGMNDVAGMEYKTGKAFHIYRPKVTDANGTEVWGELNIDEQNGLLSVTISQEFLDKAVYPVVVDPTFGYTTIGGTSSALGSFVYAALGTLSENGTVNSISFGLTPGATTCDIKGGLYASPGGARNLLSSGELVDVGSTSQAFYEVSITPYVATATNYFMAGRASSSCSIWRDSTGTWVSQNVAYASFPSADLNTTNGGDGTRLYSIYATYTASGGGGAPVTAPFMTTNTNFWGA